MQPTPGVVTAGVHPPEESMKDRIRKVQVRPITKDEMPRWKELMARHHYLGSPDMVGQVLY
jgi:hypothetical protein